MSDATILGGTPIVEFSDAVEFLSKRATNPCPSCGHDGWVLSPPFRGPKSNQWVASGLVAVKLADGTTVSQGLPLVLVTCKKCAFIKMHGVVEISQWIADGKPEFKQDD